MDPPACGRGERASDPWGRRLSRGFGFLPPPGRDPFCGSRQIAPRYLQLDIGPRWDKGANGVNRILLSFARHCAPAWARAIAAFVESILRIASRTFRRPDPVWFDLNDHLLADIGETRAEAEAEAARCVWRTPLGTMAERVISQDLA